MKRIDRSADFILRMNKFADDCEKGIQVLNGRYRQAKAEIETQCAAQLRSVTTWQKQASQQLQEKCNEIISGVSSLLQELDKLDAVITRVDKYYEKTKVKAADSNEMPNLKTSDDYAEALRQVVGQYKAVSAKYTEKTLPFLINDLNYLLSKRRKQDYSELLSLRRLAMRLDAEVKENLQEVRREELISIESKASAQQLKLQQKRDNDLQALEIAYHEGIDRAADTMCTTLEEVLPDPEIYYLRNTMAHSLGALNQINTSAASFPQRLMLYTYMFPVRDYVSMPMIQRLLLSKCESLVRQDDIVVLPVEYDYKSPMNLIFRSEKRTDAVVKSMQQILYTFLCRTPVSKLKIAVVDPEHHGNSIAPFFELQRIEPDMIYQNIAVTPDDITKLISNLSDYIDETLRYRLTDEEDTIYDTPEEAGSILLVLFDYPSHINDNSLSLLRNILRNGYRCGIHTMIMANQSANGNIQAERRALMGEVESLCVPLDVENDILFANGLECLFPILPESKVLSAYINKYLLTCSSIKNESFIFHNTIKNLIIADDEPQANTAISALTALAEKAEKTWCKAALNAEYPEHIVLGGAYYPFSVFAGRQAEGPLRANYQVCDRKGTGAGIKQDYVFLPYCISTRDGFNLYLEHTDKEAKGAQSVIHHIMWRFLSSFPVSKIRFSIISCERSLNALFPFVDMQKKLPDVFDEGVCVTADTITQRLQRISQFIDDALQNKLGNQYENMVDYNIGTPNRAEPMNVLVIFDYPKGFDSNKNELLSNIIRNGRKCGVFVIICHNTDLQYSRYDSIHEYLNAVKKNCISMLYKANTLYLQPYGLEMDLDQQPDQDTITRYVADYAVFYDQMQRKGLDFKEITDATLFSRSAAKRLEIPIGLGDGDSVINLCFGSGSSHHALIAGATGSGKSTLLHTLIMSSMAHYAPSQLHLYLLDFKSGTEFKAYENNRLPHMKLLALDAMQEFGESILEDLVQEMTRRGDAFKQAGCSKVEDYILTTGNELPRILVIMDEFQILYNDSTNRRVANNCAELTKRLVTEGRAFGIHLIMATQSTKVITNLALESGTIEQMRVRIGMKCGESDARYLFSDRNERKALQMMKGPIGTAVMNLEYTEDDNIGLRVAYCSKSAMDQYQKVIAEKFTDVPYTLQIFEGRRTIDYLDYIADNGRMPYESSAVEIDMGVMIKVAPPFSLTVDRKKRHNLLICGSNERMTTNLVTVYQLAVLRNRLARIVDIDGEWLVSENYEGSLAQELSACLPRYRCCTDRKEIVLAVKDLHEEYLRRKNEGFSDPLFVFIRNLQYLDLIQQMLKGDRVMEADYLPTQPAPAAALGMFDFGQSFNTDSGSVTDKLLAVINDGASYGIFFLLTSLEYQVIKECMHYGANTLPKFPERIIFSLGDADADHLIEGVSVSKIRENTVCFTDGVKKAFQYKPYIMPDRAALLSYVKENLLP